MPHRGRILLLCLLLIIAAVPVWLAAQSPLLAWREPVYIAAGFAGVLGLAVMLFQPLLALGELPGAAGTVGRGLHRVIGATLLALVVVHVGGLWITSPPDVIDALLFVSPTPFSAWGVIAMWAVFAAAAMAALRRRIRPALWRRAHAAVVTVIVLGTVVHALLIQGTMEWASKVVLCLAVVVALLRALVLRRLLPFATGRRP